MNDFEWADLARLNERSFFERTMELYLLEDQLHTPIKDSMHWSRRFEYPFVLEKFNTHDPLIRQKGIIDVGAGSTALQFLIAKHGIPVTSSDVDPSATSWVKSHNLSNINVDSFGVPALPYKENQFAIAFCISVLEHLPKDQVLPAIKQLQKIAEKEVIITMDICMSKNPVQTDINDLKLLLPMLGFQKLPEFQRSIIMFHIDNNDFVVACLRLRKN